MTVTVRTSKLKDGYPIGSNVVDAFPECAHWMLGKGLSVWHDYSFKACNDQTHCWVDWTFKDHKTAMLFKLTFGGR
jgi:hypothetical protein